MDETHCTCIMPPESQFSKKTRNQVKSILPLPALNAVLGIAGAQELC